MDNRIVVIDSGSVVEDGSHAELLRIPDGRYAKLWHAQTGPSEPPPARPVAPNAPRTLMWCAALTARSS